MTTAQPALMGMAGVALTAALLLGGGTMQGLPGDAIVIALGLVLGVLLVWTWPAQALARHRVELVLLAGVLVLPLLQLIPLPPVLWTQLAGRAALAADQAGVGIGPHWAPLTLDPAGTWRAWLALLPGAALFVTALVLPRRALERLTLLIPLLALAGALLGFAQMAGGPDSPLRFYAYTHRDSAVGFFANRDHFSDLLNVGLLLAAAWLIALWQRHVSRRALPALAIAGWSLLLATLLVGLMLARSRAGVGLGLVGLTGIGVLAWRAGQDQPRLTRRVMLVLLVALVLALQYGLYAVLSRLQQDPFDDARWWIMRTTVAAAHHYGLLGSGFGSFVHALPQFQIRATLIPQYVNHAHDDWLELWLEGGIPAALLMAAFVIWWLWRSVQAWRAPPAGRTLAERTLAGRTLADASPPFDASPLAVLLPRAAAIAVLLLLAHAAVDYALRTLALEATLAILCAWLA
ncbi:MAG TPA: O-antigen ligase family protein, partial [Rhodanobacteraceae bacterium]|nr:O-antigen ligase family protein [Rhodanobacteraceae bacterium]